MLLKLVLDNDMSYLISDLMSGQLSDTLSLLFVQWRGINLDNHDCFLSIDVFAFTSLLHYHLTLIFF